MADIVIKIIPEHIAYTAEYDISDYYDFYDFETGSNILLDLEELMHEENPDVHVPEIPNDYNYFTHPQGEIPQGRMHVHYYDMVDCKGIDNKDGKYRFVTVPEINAVCKMHSGSFNNIGSALEKQYSEIEKAGLTICGDSRISAIHGPWDCDDEEDYLLEIQIPVKQE